MHSRLREGTALQNDLTRYELQLELFELQLTQIIDAKKILNYQLTSTLQLPAATIIIPTEKLAGMQIEDSKQENWHMLDMFMSWLYQCYVAVELKC